MNIKVYSICQSARLSINEFSWIQEGIIWNGSHYVQYGLQGSRAHCVHHNRWNYWTIKFGSLSFRLHFTSFYNDVLNTLLATIRSSTLTLCMTTTDTRLTPHWRCNTLTMIYNMDYSLSLYAPIHALLSNSMLIHKMSFVIHLFIKVNKGTFNIGQEIVIKSNSEDQFSRTVWHMFNLDDTLSDSRWHDDQQVHLNIRGAWKRKIYKQRPLGFFDQRTRSGTIMLDGVKQTQWWDIIGMLLLLPFVLVSREDGSRLTWIWQRNTRIKAPSDCFLQHIPWSTHQVLNRCIECTECSHARQYLNKRRIFSSEQSSEEKRNQLHKNPQSGRYTRDWHTDYLPYNVTIWIDHDKN